MIKTPFQNGRFMNICMTMLYRGVLILLWCLLLIVPGIIKSYAYRFVPYTLNDNPDLTPKEAIDISNTLTYGQKMDIFILDVSFIGWYLLGALAFGITTSINALIEFDSMRVFVCPQCT